MALRKSALAVVAAMIVSAAWAQQSPMPEEIAWKLLELGHVIDPPKTTPAGFSAYEHGLHRPEKYHGPFCASTVTTFLPARR